MSLLIPGRTAPSKEIDIYLRPLVGGLKELWEEGVQTFDSEINEYFQLHAALVWTIKYFHAYRNLSG